MTAVDVSMSTPAYEWKRPKSPSWVSVAPPQTLQATGLWLALTTKAKQYRRQQQERQQEHEEQQDMNKNKKNSNVRRRFMLEPYASW